MLRHLNTIAVLSFLMLSLAGCKIADDLLSLPDATQSGRHTFGCKVDGKNWTPYTDHTLDRAIEETFSPDYFSVRVENELGDVPYVYFQIGDSTGIKEQTYRIREGFHAIVTRATPKDSILSDELSTIDADLEGYVIVTKLKQPTGKINDPGILAGTFSFTARSYRTGQTITVSEGRFDFALR